MSEETAEYQVKSKSDTRNALKVLKQAALQVLYQARSEGPFN